MQKACPPYLFQLYVLIMHLYALLQLLCYLKSFHVFVIECGNTQKQAQKQAQKHAIFTKSTQKAPMQGTQDIY